MKKIVFLFLVAGFFAVQNCEAALPDIWRVAKMPRHIAVAAVETEGVVQRKSQVEVKKEISLPAAKKDDRIIDAMSKKSGKSPDEIRRMRESGMSFREIARELGLNPKNFRKK